MSKLQGLVKTGGKGRGCSSVGCWRWINCGRWRGGGEWGFVGPHLNSCHGCTDGAGYREDKVGDGTGVGVHEAEPP